MQGDMEDLSVKAAGNLTANRQTEIKVKQRSSVTKTSFWSYFISHHSKKRLMIIFLL